MEHVRAALDQYAATLREGLDHEHDAYEVAYYRLHLAQAELLGTVLDEGGLDDTRVDAWLKLEQRAHAASYLPGGDGERCEVAFLNLVQALGVGRRQSGFSAQ
jgi:hypothetical protein